MAKLLLLIALSAHAPTIGAWDRGRDDAEFHSGIGCGRYAISASLVATDRSLTYVIVRGRTQHSNAVVRCCGYTLHRIHGN